jgi:hypothetical protein
VLLHDLTDYLRLSAALHLQLSAEVVGRENILLILTNHWPLAQPGDREVLLKVFDYLSDAYGMRKRLVGPPAILHPLRATSLLTMAAGRPHLLDMLTELLHDKYEDITIDVLGRDRFVDVESKFLSLLQDIDPTDEWYLMERLDHLTIKKGESYYQYVGRLLDKAVKTGELVRVKLADRLDNTLDLHIEIEDSLRGVDFFRVIFQLLFLSSGSGYDPGCDHPITPPLNGAQRLYQLFKNAVLLSMIREKHLVVEDPTAIRLFEALALASMYEAQRITLHVIAFHETDTERQRELLMDVLRYAQGGGLTRITSPQGGNPLDGLFMKNFDYADSEDRDAHLNSLYQNKGLMLQAALGFVVIFLNFVNSPDYWIRGISHQGISVADN